MARTSVGAAGKITVMPNGVSVIVHGAAEPNE